jgi:SAM-dependent methyltransferase
MSSERDAIDLSSLNPTGRFSDRADDYVKYRPDYPTAAFDAIIDGLGDPRERVAADVGAGTGISARLLADRGMRVIAVEPNAAMRAAASAHLRVEWREGSAEATGLAPTSVDLVVCAQAFHWFRPQEAVAEFRRILRPSGRLALMWNMRDDCDECTRGYTEAIRAVTSGHPAEHRELEPPGVVEAGGFFAPPRLLTFEHVQRLDRAGLVGRATSASYVPKDAAALATLERLLTELHARCCAADGLVSLRYRTDVYLSRAV